MIETWYDRHTKDYVIQTKDSEGNQIGEAVRVGNKPERDYLVNLMKLEERKGMDNYITLTDWAKSHGISDGTARQRANRGAFETAFKMGRIWLIRKDEELIDHRIKLPKNG